MPSRFDHARPQTDAAPQGLVLSRYVSMRDIEALAAEWRALERHSTAQLTYFQTHGWCWHWLQAHAGNRYRPHVLALRENGRLVAVWPLMEEEAGMGVRVLRTLGEPHSQYSGVLAETGRLTDTQASMLGAAVANAPGIDAAFINLLPTTDALRRALPKRSILPAAANAAVYLELTQFARGQDYLDGLSRTQKRNRSRSLNMLGRDGEIGFSVLRPGEEDFAAAISTGLSFKRQWLKETGRIGAGLGIGDHASFLASLPRGEQDGDGPLVSVLTVGEQPVAIEIGFLRAGHYCAYLGSFDWRHRKASPGRLQMEMTIAWLIDGGAVAYDLLANTADYKTSFSNSLIPLDSHIVDRTWRGAIYARLWLGYARPALKRTWHALPLSWRLNTRRVFDSHAGTVLVLIGA